MMKLPSILVTCPTAKPKDYSLQPYLAAYENFKYPNKQLLIIDTTTDDGEYYEYMSGLNIDHLLRYECSPDVGLPYLITKVWEDEMLAFAWEHKFDWILNLEVDIIAPPTLLNYLLNVANTFNAAMVAHSYKQRAGGMTYRDGIGCIMWKREIFEPGHNFLDYAEATIRRQIWETGAPTVELTNVLNLIHLDEGEEIL